MKVLVVAYPEGKKEFAEKLVELLQGQKFAARAFPWAEVPLEGLVSNPHHAALIVCYGKRPEDTDVSTWHTCKINRVKVLPVQTTGTVCPAIYADIQPAKFMDGKDWAAPLAALVKALA